MTGARDRLMAFRRAQPSLPRLTRRDIISRGLRFAVFTTPDVTGATPLACVNGGLLFDHSLLWPALAPLSPRRQLVFYDQRGRGASEVPANPASARLKDDAADLGALRQALGVREWDILGHSWGGAIAMLGAEQDLAGTRRLVLVDSVGATSACIMSLRKAANDRLLPRERALLRRYDTSEADVRIQSAYARALFPAWFSDRALAEFIPLPRSTSATGASISARINREGYDWTPSLRALDRPTIVIHGEQDVLPVESAKELAATLPDATLAVVPGAGHLPFLEAPDLFFRLVEEFLSDP